MDAIKGLIQCSFAKDLNFSFTSTTDTFAQMAGCDSAAQMLGKDDYQLAWRRDANYFRQTDASIISSLKTYTQLESIQTRDHKFGNFSELKETKIIITKAPLIDSMENCIGICGSLIDVTHLSFLPKIGVLDEQNRLLLGEPFNDYLTECEIKVLKEIMFHAERAVAKRLGVSRGTVSTHLQNIKRKLQCRNIVELRKSTILSGLVHELFDKGVVEQYAQQKIAMNNQLYSSHL